MKFIRHVVGMWFGKFISRSFLLSFPVALFWLPVLAMAAYGALTVFDLLRDEIIGLIMLFVLLVQPVLTLLSILAIRAGMMIIKVTAGSEIGSIAFVTARVLRFNVPIMTTVIVLFGLSTTITGLKLLDSNVIEEFNRVSGFTSRFKSYFLFEVIKQFPIVLVGGWIFGTCVAYAAMAVNIAGSAAMAVSSPPNHHQIWGLGAQFLNVFLVALIVWFLPFIVGVILLGGFGTELSVLLEMNKFVLYGVGVYILWTVCVMAAASAQAYKIHLADDDVRRTRDIEEMTGMASDGKPAVDLKALRQARMGGTITDAYAANKDEE